MRYFSSLAGKRSSSMEPRTGATRSSGRTTWSSGMPSGSFAGKVRGRYLSGARTSHHEGLRQFKLVLGNDRNEHSIRQVRREVEVIPRRNPHPSVDLLEKHDVEASHPCTPNHRKRRLPARRVGVESRKNKEMFLKTYYNIKPLIPRRLQLAMRRLRARVKLRTHADVWPIDEKAAIPPKDWNGWPDGKKFAFVLTHDVDTAKGQERTPAIGRFGAWIGVHRLIQLRS